MPEASSSIGGFLWGAVAFLSSTSVAWALGIGAVDNQTVLGAPLRLAIPVQGGNPPPPECVKAQVRSGEDTLAPKSVHTRVEAGRDGLYRVHVSSDVRILEPVVSVMLSLGCESAFQREFVLFVDPPGPMQAPPPVVTALALPLAPTALPATPAVGPAAGRPTRPQPTPPARSGPRLSLEPATVLGSPRVAPAPSFDEAAMAHQEDLLNQLEDLLKQVTSDSQAVQASVAGLQAKLRSAEDALKQERERSREQPLIVWGLAGLVGLLALALALVLWRQQRRRPTPFFQRSGVLDEASASASNLPILDSMPSLLQVAEPELVKLRAGPVVQAPVEPSAPPVVPRGKTVEVVDIEQEADFFIALGQDQAAIDLLSTHVNVTSSHGPLPYLKLLDIHRRRGDRMSYEQLRLRFHQRFNARVPEWDAPAAASMGLEDYPEVQQSLEAHWVSPSSAVKLLETFLFRRDGQSTTFDLFAYRDLLMLYAVARDLASSVVGAANGAADVDLELPLANMI